MIRRIDALMNERLSPSSMSFCRTALNCRTPNSAAGVRPYNSRTGRRTRVDAVQFAVWAGAVVRLDVLDVIDSQLGYRKRRAQGRQTRMIGRTTTTR